MLQFNDKGNDINENVEVREATDDVVRFKQEIIGLEFESYNGGRDSKERLMQGLKMAVLQSPPKSLISPKVYHIWLWMSHLGHIESIVDSNWLSNLESIGESNEESSVDSNWDTIVDSDP